MLEASYRYQRPRPSRGNGFDAYNGLLVESVLSTRATRALAAGSKIVPLEYWTNGTTTHIMSSSSATAATPHERANRSSLLSQRPSSSSPPPIVTLAPRRRATPPPAITTTASMRRVSVNDRSSDSSRERLVRNSIMAGSVSGMASTIALYPMDVVRTKMQSSAGTGSIAAVGRGGPVRVLKHTLRHGGARALYTGLSLPLAAQAVYKSTVFTVNNVTERFLLDFKTWENRKTGVSEPAVVRLTLTDRFWSGFCGGAVNAALFVTPVEFVRNQAIAQHSKRAAAAAAAAAAETGTKTGASSPSSRGYGYYSSGNSSWHIIRNVVRQHGVLSLWRGIQWSIARDGFGCGCFFVTMAWTQQQLKGYRREDDDRPLLPSLAVTMISGGTAGLAFWVASLPMDTVKTWVQSSDVTEERISPVRTIQRVYRNDGPAAVVNKLFRGWQVAYGRGIPSAAITFSVYSLVYQSLQQQQQQQNMT